MDTKEIKDLIEKSSCPVVSGLIGEDPSTYSKSRIMWNAVCNYHEIDSEYIPFDVPTKNFESVLEMLLENDKVRGFNVTIPYKELVAKHKSIAVDSPVRVIGALNTVHKINEEIQGHSTDGYGAVRSIEEKCKGAIKGKDVLVIGAGGAGTAVAVACAEEGGNVVLANRTYSKAKELSERATKYNIKPMKLYSEGGYFSDEFVIEMHMTSVIINTLSVEKMLKQPLFRCSELDNDKKQVCMDVVYGHQSFFLETAQQECHLAISGEWMLLHQAVKAFEHVYQEEVQKKGLTTAQITAPMRYAINNFKFNESNEAIKTKVENARSEIEDLII